MTGRVCDGWTGGGGGPVGAVAVARVYECGWASGGGGPPVALVCDG